MNTCNSNTCCFDRPKSGCFDRPKSAKEECKERKLYNQTNKGHDKMTMNKNNANCVLGRNSYLDLFKKTACAFIRPCPASAQHDIHSMNGCDSNSVADRCLPNEDHFEVLKQFQEQRREQSKIDKKRAKAKYKDCKKKAKAIYKKYKQKEKERRKEEKAFYKECLKREKEKVKAAKAMLKQIKKCTKEKMKENKRKHKQKLKRLKEKLKRRCEDVKFNYPKDNQTDSAESELEDPTAPTPNNLHLCAYDTCFKQQRQCQKIC